jgi:hypothetical protein
MTLLGFENMRWTRGNRSVIFTAHPSQQEGQVTINMTNIDHDARLAYVEESDVVVRLLSGPGASACARRKK